MKFKETSLQGVLVIEPEIFSDERGFFLECSREDVFREAGITGNFVQVNHSRSGRGTLRGLHYQLVQPQGKLGRVARGAVFDVAVDIRKGSPTFGNWFGTTLDDESMHMMYTPPGYAHGFVVLSDKADFIYQCTDYYHPQSEQGIAWDDPDIAIEWPISEITLSERDRRNPNLADQKNIPEY